MEGEGMYPDVWGPMTWRLVHGMAKRFDETKTSSKEAADLFYLFLLHISWVLPCVHCRVSYQRFLTEFSQGSPGKKSIQDYFEEGNAGELACIIHNLVNQKLNKPQVEWRLVQLRSRVWTEFNSREFFGLLFIIALNFKSNGEPNSKQHYQDFFSLLPELCEMLSYDRLAACLQDAGIMEARTFQSQRQLTKVLYAAYVTWLGGREHVPPLDSVVKRYQLCKVKST